MGLGLALCHGLWGGEGRRRKNNEAKGTRGGRGGADPHSARRGRCHQRARAMMRLAHISKKSMVWLPRRGGSEGMLPTKEPLREPVSDWHSVAAAASMLRRGRCKPAAEQERWGVEEPDLCSITSSWRAKKIKKKKKKGKRKSGISSAAAMQVW